MKPYTKVPAVRDFVDSYVLTQLAELTSTRGSERWTRYARRLAAVACR
ncbi:MAG: hypothetical protein ACRDRA_06555 [Pseudonocardiaceae bacterium]